MKEIDGVVKKFKPIPDKGYVVKIPLAPSIQLENNWVYALIDEVIIIIPKNEKPYLLVFDDENKPYFLTFETRIDTLLKTLDFSLWRDERGMQICHAKGPLTRNSRS